MILRNYDTSITIAVLLLFLLLDFNLLQIPKEEIAQQS